MGSIRRKEASAAEREHELWTASERYMSGKIEVDALEDVELPYAQDFEYATLMLGKKYSRKAWLARMIAVLLMILLGGTLIIAFFQQWQLASSVMPTYLAFNNQLVAQVQVNSTKIPRLLSVKLTLYDKNHHPTNGNFQCYIQPGDTLTFHGDVLNFAPWLNSLGLHPGYKLTKIIGCYSNASSRDPRALLIPNNGEDGYFTELLAQPWVFSLASAEYSKPFILQPSQLKLDQKSAVYNIYTSQTGSFLVSQSSIE